MFHAKMKHIKVHYHFIQERFLSRDINLVYVSIDEHVVDIVTKALGVGCEDLEQCLEYKSWELSLRRSVEMLSSI